MGPGGAFAGLAGVILLLVFLSIAAWVFWIVMFIDALKHRDTLWIVLFILSFFTGFLSAVLSTIYFFLEYRRH